MTAASVLVRRRRALVAVALVLAAACGKEAGDVSVVETPPRQRVEQLADSEGSVVVVRGALVAAAGRVPFLCEALAESYPPQCAGARVAVPELDVTRIGATTSNSEAPADQRVVWTDRPVELTGRVEYQVMVLVADPVSGDDPAVLVHAQAGPTCPVETAPPPPACADQPVAGARIELHDRDGEVVAATTTDALGQAVFLSPRGNYQVVASPVAGLVGTPDTRPVTVSTGTTVVSMAYDTGIRRRRHPLATPDVSRSKNVLLTDRSQNARVQWMGRKPVVEPDVALERVMRRFWAHGYEATSIDDLLEVTGMHRGSFYRLFGDKRSAFQAALGRYGEMVGDRHVLAGGARSGLAVPAAARPAVRPSGRRARHRG